MKNTRAIYQKLREVKYFHLVRLYKQLLRKVPENCQYNYRYVISKDGDTIQLCLLHQPNIDLSSGVHPHLIDVCNNPHHSVNCNGFVLKYDKEGIKKFFEEELSNRPLKEKKYPDICALEWVLDQTSKVPEPSLVRKIMIKIKNSFKGKST